MLHGKLVFLGGGGTATAGVAPVLGSSGLGGVAPHTPLKKQGHCTTPVQQPISLIYQTIYKQNIPTL